jgi:hypothetical protein
MKNTHHSAVSLSGITVCALLLALTGCSRTDQANFDCEPGLRRDSTLNELAQGLQKCIEDGKEKATAIIEAQAQHIGQLGVDAPVISFERHGGLNFSSGIAIPRLGLDFNLTNNAGLPISSVTYAVEVVGDGQMIGRVELTSRLKEVLFPGETAHVAAPIELSGDGGNWQALLTSRHVTTNVHLLKAE